METMGNRFVFIRSCHDITTKSERSLEATLFTTLNTSEEEPKSALNLSYTQTMELWLGLQNSQTQSMAKINMDLTAWVEVQKLICATVTFKYDALTS